MTAETVLIILLVVIWAFALSLVGRDIRQLRNSRRQRAHCAPETLAQVSRSRYNVGQADDYGPLQVSPNVERITTQAQKRRQRRARR